MSPPRMFDESSSWMSKFMNRKRFHFFKIIIPNIIQQKRLGLPRKFIRKFRKELSEVVVLTVPNGKKWHVELKEIEGEMWLVDGWQEFVDYYSIADGHFLVFGYDWRSCFHVLIFDMSAAEIEYPCHIKDFEEPNQENECQAPSNENESVEILDVSPPGPTRAESVKRVSNESDQHQTSTMRHLKLKVKCEAPSEASDSVEIVDVSPPGPIRAESVKRVSNESDRHQTSTMRHLKLKVKCEAPSEEGSDSVEIVDVSPPSPIRAESVKRVSNESDRHQTSTMRHLKLKVTCEAPSEEGSVSVEIVDVSPPSPIRAESVKRVSNESDRHQTSTMRHLKLKVKCEAPSEEGSDSVEILDVSPPGPIRAESVKRVSNESDRHQTSTMRHLKLKVKCEAPSEEGSDSVEIVDVSPKRQKRTDFMKEVIDESEAQQTSKVRRHTPSSRLRYSLRSFERKVTRPTSESHWRCRTQVKSSPKRDRNSTKNAEAFSPCQVTQSTESDGCDSPLTEESSDHIPTIFLRRWPVTTLMSRVDRDFKSDNPFFLVPMQSSYVNEPFMLNVPSNFAKEYFEQDLCLSLRVSDGRSWQVRCCSVNSNAKISWGWRKFVKENHLKEGDVCVFELVNRRKVEMKVVIYQATS